MGETANRHHQAGHGAAAGARGAGGGARRRYAVTAGLAMSVAVGWSYSNVSAVAPELADDYGVSVSAIGLLTTVVLIVHTVMQLPTGRALDRLGPRRVAIAGLAVLTASNLITTLIGSFWAALPARTLLGVGTALVYLGGLDLIRRLGAAAALSSAFGALNGASLGMALLIIPQLDPWLGWRGPYLTSLVLIAVGIAAIALAPEPRSREHAASAPPAPAKPTPSLVLLRDRRLLRLSAMNLASAGFPPIVSAWVVTLLVEAGGFSTAKAGAVGSLSLLGMIVSRPIAGWIVHRRPRYVVPGLIASSLLGAGGTVMLAFVGPLWLAILGSAFVGFGTGVPWTYVFQQAPLVRPEASGAALAVVNMTPLVIAITGIPLIGLTFDMPGDGRIGFLALAGIWLLLLLVRPLPEGRSDGRSGAT